MENRFFIVGSEWLYYKVYSGFKIADNIVLLASSIANELLEKKLIDKWFFIRYADPEFHIRIRFHILNNEDIGEIINICEQRFKPLLFQDLISNIQIDTYERELKRYGELTINQAETLFFYDSIFVSSLLKLKVDENKKWLFGMRFIDEFLDLWGLNLEIKKNILEGLKIDFGKEHGVNKKTRKQLNHKYRENDKIIDNFLENSDQKFEFLFSDFKIKATPIINCLINDYSNLSKVIVVDILSSYIHMHCNRLFRSRPRTNEWVLYELLYCYYNKKYSIIKYSRK